MEEGPDCSPSNSWPVASPAVTSRPRFLHVRGAESCYQPIYQNRSILLFCHPFLLPSPRAKTGPIAHFPFVVSTLLSSSWSAQISLCLYRFTRATVMSLLRLSRRVKYPLIEAKWNEDFVSYYIPNGTSRYVGFERKTLNLVNLIAH